MLDPFFFSNDYGILDGMGQLASMNMNSGKLDTRAILYRPTAGKKIMWWTFLIYF
jgi:hypothetical protein